MVCVRVVVSNLLCLFSFTVDTTSRSLITISIKYGTKQESIEVENPVEGVGGSLYMWLSLCRRKVW